MYPYPNAADTPEATAAFIRKELDSWGRVIRELNIQPE
jgi:tripartite-type tricarboxylate transporter receptor subunit TctC